MYIFLSLFGLRRKQGLATDKWQSGRGHSASKSDILNLPANAGDVRDADSIPGLGRSPGEGHGNLLQYPRPENPTDRGAWRATVRGVTQSRTRLSDLRCTHAPGVRGPGAVHQVILWPHLHPQGIPISSKALPERPGGPQGVSPQHPYLVLARWASSKQTRLAEPQPCQSL